MQLPEELDALKTEKREIKELVYKGMRANFIKQRAEEIVKQSGGEMGKCDVDRRFNHWYNTNKAAVKGIKVVFTASLRGGIYGWTST